MMRWLRRLFRPTVYHVTNLEPYGTGSLMWAIDSLGTRGGRIVFDVRGLIDFETP